ncbi:MAG: hypothetical protein AAFR91_13315, partial [Pseudomonadota bacterium]
VEHAPSTQRLNAPTRPSNLSMPLNAGVQMHERGWRKTCACTARDRHLVSAAMIGYAALR